MAVNIVYTARKGKHINAMRATDFYMGRKDVTSRIKNRVPEGLLYDSARVGALSLPVVALVLLAVEPVAAQGLCDVPTGDRVVGLAGGGIQSIVGLAGLAGLALGFVFWMFGSASRGASGVKLMLGGMLCLMIAGGLPLLSGYFAGGGGGGGSLASIGLGCMF